MKIPRIKKVKTKTNGFKFEVRYLENGRGSRHRAYRFDSRDDAQTFIMKLMDEEKAFKGQGFLDNTTFAVEADFWLETRGRSFSHSHLIKVRGILREVLPDLGCLKPERFHHGFLTEFQAKQLRQGLNPKTVNHKIQTIKAIIKHSFQCKRIPHNPVAGFAMLKSSGTDIEFWDRDEAESFLSFADLKYPLGCPMRWVYVVYLAALNTGMRAGEIWGLTFTGTKAIGDVLRVDKQFDRSIQEIGPTKGKAARHVPCNPHLREEMSRLLKSPHRHVTAKSLFHHGDTGEPICHEVFRRRFFEIDLKEAGIRRIRFHDLRHTAATLMIDRGVDLVTVSKILGHKEMKTTMLYLHMLPNKIADTAALFSVIPRAIAPQISNPPRLVVV